MIIKVEMLLDSNLDEKDHVPSIICALLDQVFKDNKHLANIIICDVEIEKENEHRT